MKRVIRVILVLGVILCSLGLEVYGTEVTEPSPKSNNEQLAEALKELKDVTLKKIDLDVENVAQTFASVKSYWRVKRWADIFGPVLDGIQNIISIAAKVTTLKDLTNEVNNAFDSSKATYEVVSLGLMVQNVYEMGGKLRCGISGPAYLKSVKQMLDKADAVNPPLEFDAERYTQAIKNHLYDPAEEKELLVIPHFSTTIPRERVEFVNGALLVRKRIAETFDRLIAEVTRSSLPQDFPVSKVISLIRELKTKVAESMDKEVDIRYQAYLQDKGQDVLSDIEIKLGQIAQQNKRFAGIAGAVAEKVTLEEQVEVTHLLKTGTNLLQITITSKIPGMQEPVQIVQQAILISEITIKGKIATFYPNVEQQFYISPQEMLLSLPNELSNLWIIADDIDHYLRYLLRKEFSSSTGISPDKSGIPASAIAVVMDRSGSMEGEKLAKAKDAAESFFAVLNSEDYAALVSFNESAQTHASLEAMTPEKRDSLVGETRKIQAGGNTNIGAGLTNGFEELKRAPDSCNKSALLMSDGMHNTGELWPGVKLFEDKSWPVYTVAYGGDADLKTLEEIAKRTGGIFFGAGTFNISQVYHRISANLKNQSVLLAQSDAISQGEELKYQIAIDKDITSATFFADWHGSTVEVRLIGPDRKEIKEDNVKEITGVDYKKGETYCFYRVSNPQAGDWQIILFGKEINQPKEQINLTVSGSSPLSVNVFGFQPGYQRGETIILSVRVAKGFGGEDIDLDSVEIKATVKKPGRTIKNIEKDGVIDLSAFFKKRIKTVKMEKTTRENDIIFSGIFNDTDLKGKYILNVDCQAKRYNGEKIAKTIEESIWIGDVEKNK